MATQKKRLAERGKPGFVFQKLRSGDRKFRQVGNQPVQGVNGGKIRNAIHQCGPEMPLERRHGALGFFTIVVEVLQITAN